MVTRIPKQKRSIEKFETILYTTIRIINEGRFFTTSTHTIARESKVGIGTVYDYFDSKEDILKSALELESSNIWGEIEQAKTTYTNVEPLDFISLLISLLIDHAYENSGFVKVAFGYIPGVLENNTVAAYSGKLKDLFRNLIEKNSLNKNMKLSNEEIESKAFLLVNMLIGVMLGVAHGPPSISKHALMSELDQNISHLVDNKTLSTRKVKKQH